MSDAHEQATPWAPDGTDEAARHGGPSRRSLLGGGALLGGTALAGAVAGHAVTSTTGAGDAPAGGQGSAGSAAATPAIHGQQTIPFHGEHQAGIDTPHQAHGVFVGMNLARGSNRAKVASMLRILTDDAERLTAGRPPLGALEDASASTPGRLTVTFAFGPGFFDATGTAARCPGVVGSFPTFATDELEPAWGQTDLLIQICSEDPVTLTYAQRRLVRDAAAFATIAWAQRGFLNARGTEPDGTTRRNLMGMRDGTANEVDPEQIAQVLWSTDARYPWLRGGTQLVLRRIRIDMRTWDDVQTPAKELSFGRQIASGAPLGGTREAEPVNRVAVDD